MAFFNSGVGASHNSINPASVGVDGTVIYHFQADPGFSIANAAVTSSIFIAGDDSSSPKTGSGSVTGSYSIDNLTYYDFDSVVYTGGDAMSSLNGTNLGNLASDPFAGSTDLYLKYVVTRGVNPNHSEYPSYTQLFRSNTGSSFRASGFEVDLDLEPAPVVVAPVPDPRRWPWHCWVLAAC